ncbi:MAG TPA: ImmA/IrrE family metallo-endopeptidase [Polyangia bacterium]|jgi:Zn-dependent peptidase ImmA (M78 family)/DNA-binding XRE family transcriptional regulator
MSPDILGSNIRRLRMAKGVSQADLAEAAGLSRPGYRNVEVGAATPRTSTLMRIAEALGVKLEALVREHRQLRAVRFRAKKRLSTREEIIDRVSRWLDDYEELERLLDQHAPVEFAAVRRKIGELRSSATRAIEAAGLARQAMGVGERELVRDICGLLEHHGVKVFTPKVASDDFFGLSVGNNDGGPAVVINTWERISVERWIFSAAHELGHLLLHDGAYDVTQREEVDAEEREANTFASHFLMPEGLFRREWVEARGLPLVARVFKVKRIFRVSYRTVLYRSAAGTADMRRVFGRFQVEHQRLTGKTLGVADEPQQMSPDDFRSHRPASRAADEPEHLLASDFVEDRLSWLVRSALEKDVITLSRAAEILGIPLQEMRERASSWVE